MIAERLNELERSLSYWIRAKKLQPEDPEILLGFGRVCLRMDLLDDAEPALTRAAGQRPDDPAYQYTLAAAKVGKRQYESAQRLLELAGGEAAGRSAVAVRAGRRSLRARTPGRRSPASAGEPALQPGQLASRYTWPWLPAIKGTSRGHRCARGLAPELSGSRRIIRSPRQSSDERASICGRRNMLREAVRLDPHRSRRIISWGSS